MEEVKPLAPVVARNENVITFFREALKLAEKGEVHGAILVMQHSDGATSDRWATMGGLYPTNLIGALFLCLTRYTERARQLTEPE